MNIDAAFAMKDTDALTAAVQRAALRKPSPAELLAQRVSFVFASVSEKSGVTKDQVRKVIIDQAAGIPATA